MALLLDSTQLSRLRSDGHKSKFYLSVAKPQTVLTCQVNNPSIARGATAIAVDNGTAASLAAVKAGMTLEVTTSTGTFRVRIADLDLSGTSPTISGTITVDTNPILWGDNQTIAVYSLYEPWSIMPTFNATTGVSTKRGQTFANQTKFPNPLINMGPHRPGFVDGGSLVFSLSATGVPMTPGASISSYAWSSDIGSLSATNVSNPTLTINTPGEGWIYCTVTDSGGKTHKGNRYVWAHSTDPDAATYPYTDFEATGLSISFSGGVRASFKVSGVADFTQFFDGALVCLWKETWYGSTKTHISLNTGAEGQLFVGYIVKDSIITDPVYGSVTFEVQSLADIAKSLAMQALSIHAESVVQFWFQMPTWMTMKHMLHWLLYWHSNLLEIADWNLTAITTLKKLFTFNDGNLGSQAADVASKLVAQIGCNKAGQMFVERNIQFLSASERAAMDVVMNVTEADWTGQRTIVRRPYPVQAAVELKGYYFDGTDITPYCSVAPTRNRAGRGNKTNQDGMMVTSQGDANFLSGRFQATANNPIEEIRVQFAGDYSVLDVFPQRWYTTTVTTEDTLRGITLTSIRMVPRTVNLQLNTKDGVCLVDAVFEAEAFGPDGITVACPTGGTTPPVVEPTYPPRPGGSGGSDALLSLSSAYFLSGLTATEWKVYEENFTAYDADLDPFWKIKSASSNPRHAIAWLAGSGGAVRRVKNETDIVDRFLSTDPANSWSDTPAPTVASLTPAKIVCSKFYQSRHYLALNYYTGSLWRSWIGKTTDDFHSIAYTTMYDSDVQTKIIGMAEDGQDGSVLWVACWRNGTLYLEKYATSTMTRSSQTSLGAATLAELNANTYIARVAGVPGDKASVYVYGRMNAPAGLTGVRHVIKSANGGSSFSSVENGWSTDFCVALEVVAVSGTNTIFALRQTP